jgi:NADH-quinone oxidoreductase subunit L
MFMGIGVGAYTAGLFHLVTHAFFKALLFLGSGSVIHALSGEQDIRHMGGLRKFIPTTAITFLIGTLAIAGVPFFSGFFSKDAILGSVYERGYTIQWLIGMITVVLTAIYMGRLYLLTFEGKSRVPDKERDHIHEAPATMTIPLIILAFLSVVGGYMGVPEFMGELVGIRESNLFDRFVSSSISMDTYVTSVHHLFSHIDLVVLSISAALIGIAVACYLYYFRPSLPGKIAADKAIEPVYRGSLNKWYVDELYDYIFVQPFKFLSDQASKFDLGFIDGAVNGVAAVLKDMALTLQAAQSGLLRNYATLMAIGAFAILVFIIIWRSI